MRHAIETNASIPAEPIIFNKAPSCISGPNDPVVLPRGSTKCDWEVEIAMVIGKPALYVPEAEALDYVAGYCVCNDVSEREMQRLLKHGGQWVKGKMSLYLRSTRPLAGHTGRTRRRAEPGALA